MPLAVMLCGIEGLSGQNLVQEPVEDEPPKVSVELTDGNYAIWRDHILPADSELAFEQIPWLTTFKDGILAADRAGKPLLLWAMNGHPLGCT